MEQQAERIHEHGTMQYTVWQCDAIRLGHAVSRFKQAGHFSASSETDVIRLHFGLRGNYSFVYKQLNRTFDLIGGHHNMLFSEGFDMEVYNRTQELETFGIQFPREAFLAYTADASDALKRFGEKISKGSSSLFSPYWGAIDPAIHETIQQVIHCSYTDELKKRFLLSKSIELMVLSAEACSLSENRKAPFVKTKADKEKIIAVRDLVLQRVTDPPSLTEISRMVGMNEYKLKRGFKEVFSTTVFGYLIEQRLHLAQRFLRDTGKTAAEIAAELGYATPQHFNNAFKKRFGITPFAAKKNP